MSIKQDNNIEFVDHLTVAQYIKDIDVRVAVGLDTLATTLKHTCVSSVSADETTIQVKLGEAVGYPIRSTQDSCLYCNSCTSCNSCQTCNSCTSCNGCQTCNSCTSCNSCQTCNSRTSGCSSCQKQCYNTCFTCNSNAGCQTSCYSYCSCTSCASASASNSSCPF